MFALHLIPLRLVRLAMRTSIHIEQHQQWATLELLLNIASLIRVRVVVLNTGYVGRHIYINN